MGFQDRPYYGRQPDGFGGGPGIPRIALPRLSPVVKYLLIINCVVFLLQLVMGGRLEYAFAAIGTPPELAFQVWRLVTFQFLHSTSTPFHLLMNMVGLYFLGPLLERTWGAKRFLIFYLTAGVVGGLIFVIASTRGAFGGAYLVGASGGVLGLLVACAVLFPHIRVVLILFPMQIRTAAVLLAAVYALSVLTSGGNAGGDLCHLGGMATGFIWVVARPYLAARRQRSTQGAFQRLRQQAQLQQMEIDRILAKVHQHGINSLTRTEKITLQRATDQQRNARR